MNCKSTNLQKILVRSNWCAEEIVAHDVQLISMPEIYWRARQTMDDPNTGLSELADVISQDPGMTARILKLANSGMYRFAAPVGTVNQAITLLGTQQINDLILLTSVTRAFSGISNSSMNMDLFWQNSVNCASLSSLLGRRHVGKPVEGLFIAGLLHDIGHLIMYQIIPDQCTAALHLAETENRNLCDIETDVIGCNYTDVGGRLLENWRLPESLSKPVREHTKPVIDSPYAVESAIIHLAAGIVRSATVDVPLAQRSFDAEDGLWQLAGLDPADCSDALIEADKLSREVLDLIFPGHGQIS